jgi:hypothetical protein
LANLCQPLPRRRESKEMRRRQEAAVKRLMSEIRSRHKKINPLESAGSLDVLPRRVEMEERLQNATPSRHSLLIASGLRLAGNRIGSEGGRN